MMTVDRMCKLQVMTM